MNTTEFKAHHFTIIGKNTKLNGDIHLQDESQIWGKIEGNIVTLERITIERTADIAGSIICNDLVISGRFHGTIESKGIVTLRSSAQITGQLKANSIVIQPGAHIEANMNTYE